MCALAPSRTLTDEGRRERRSKATGCEGGGERAPPSLSFCPVRAKKAHDGTRRHSRRHSRGRRNGSSSSTFKPSPPFLSCMTGLERREQKAKNGGGIQNQLIALEKPSPSLAVLHRGLSEGCRQGRAPAKVVSHKNNRQKWSEPSNNHRGRNSDN